MFWELRPQGVSSSFTAKLATTEFVVHRRPIGVDLAFGQLI